MWRYFYNNVPTELNNKKKLSQQKEFYKSRGWVLEFLWNGIGN